MTRWFGEATCLLHLPRTQCTVVTFDGRPCEHTVLVRRGQPIRCGLHRELPADADRCVIEVAPGHRCPGEREPRSGCCYRHEAWAPRCAGVDSYGLQCIHAVPWDIRAGEWHQTCDRHAGWRPGQVTDDDPEWAYHRFFLRHHRDLLALLSEPDLVRAISDAGPDLGEGDVMTTGGLSAATDGGFAIEWDPYDLTGAAGVYQKAIDMGGDEELARHVATSAAHVLAPTTCATYTQQLRPYLEACRSAGVPPVPADEGVLLMFLAKMGQTGHYRTGEPLSGATMQKFMNALGRLHTVRQEQNPFDRFPRVKAVCLGYAKRYAKATVEAHGVRVDELENLLLATHAEAHADIRDTVILAVLTDPDVLVNGELVDGGMPHIAATRMTWAHIDFGPDATSDVTIRVPRARAAGCDVFTVPNRRRGLESIDTPDGMVGAARLCGVAALALLDDVRRMRGIPDSQPVLVGRTGGAMTTPAFRKVIAKAAERAGLPYQATYTADERLALLDALAEPSLLRLRDAAIMTISWWASLRRSETAKLCVGWVAEESRGRGTIVALGLDKNGNAGTFTPVGHLRNPDGTPHLIDLQRNLRPWLSAYDSWSRINRGRGLTAEDPLFPNLQGTEGEALSAKSIGDVIKRYAEAAGIHAELGERISSHGFRRGFAQEASARGVSAQEIARLQRRKSVESVLVYTGRPSNPFESSVHFLVEGLNDDAFSVDDVLAHLSAQHQRFRRR